MAERRMLREVMRVNDIYTFAEPIMQMLREEYGSYDADSLDEVMVDEVFSQRLMARGYELSPAAQASALRAAQEGSRTPATEPKPARDASEASEAAPATATRTRRTTSRSTETASKAKGGSSDRKAETTTTRTRRATSRDDTSQTSGRTTGRTTRTTRSRTSGDGSTES
jgi:hypothetical protein